MLLKSTVLGVGFALGLSLPAAAQTIIDGSMTNEILAIAKTYGAASLQTQQNGDPKISGQIEGIPYQLYFMNCTDHANCEDVQFYSGFIDTKPSLDTINAWNRDKRFARAYLDSDLDAVIEWDVNLEHGITQENADAAFGLWWLLLDEYAAYVGAK